jgi:hypothetical protein
MEEDLKKCEFCNDDVESEDITSVFFEEENRSYNICIDCRADLSHENDMNNFLMDAWR